MSYIGNTNATQGFVPAIDYFNGDGSTTAFTLSRPVASVAQIQAVVNNVAQNPFFAFTVSGNTITFTSAPSSGTNNIYVYYTSPITQTVALPQNPQVFGNLQFSSSGARITGDFSNATQSNRLMFQSSTTNNNTNVEAIPNGTATVASLVTNNNSDPLNGSIGYIQTQAAEFRVEITKRGTGTYLPMTFYTGGSERIRIDTSGNVGIGTTSVFAGYRAEIDTGASSAASNPLAMTARNTTGQAKRLYFQASGLDTTPVYTLATGAVGTDPAIAFAPTGTERMRIDTSGNVGIGTSSPSSYANYTTLTINGTDADIDLLRSGTRQFGLYTTSALTAINNLANLPLYFYTNNTSRMILDTSGNLQFNSGYGSVATAYGCRAWVNFNGTGTVAIRASGNVTSITDNGVGSYAVNLTTAMPDTNYAAVMATRASSGAGTPFLPVEHASLAARTTSSIAFYVIALNGSTPDADVVEVVFFR